MKTLTWVMMFVAFILLIGALVLSALSTGYISVAADGNTLSTDEINAVYTFNIITTVLIGLSLFVLIVYLMWWWYKTRNIAWPGDPGYEDASALQRKKQQRNQPPPMMTNNYPPSGRASPQLGYEPGRMSMASQNAYMQSMP